MTQEFLDRPDIVTILQPFARPVSRSELPAYFGAYRKYMREFNVLVQFRLAHLIRDVKLLMTLPDNKQRGYFRLPKKQ